MKSCPFCGNRPSIMVSRRQEALALATCRSILFAAAQVKRHGSYSLTDLHAAEQLARYTLACKSTAGVQPTPKPLRARALPKGGRR